ASRARLISAWRSASALIWARMLAAVSITPRVRPKSPRAWIEIIGRPPACCGRYILLQIVTRAAYVRGMALVNSRSRHQTRERRDACGTDSRENPCRAPAGQNCVG